MDSLNLQLEGSSDLNFNSVVTDVFALPPSIEHLPGLLARAAFTVSSQSVFKEDVDFSCQRAQSASLLAALLSAAENGRSHIVPTIIDESLSYMPWDGDNQPLAHRPNGR